MAITDKTRKLLWGRSGNRCAICKRELVAEATAAEEASVVGDECHIISCKPCGPRYDPTFPQGEIDSYTNLILLCRVDHKMVDDQPQEYNADTLRKIKTEHEQWVTERLTDTAVSDLAVDPGGYEDQYREFHLYEGNTRRQIIKRGCWDVVIRPTPFVRERLGIQDLYPLLENISIKRDDFQFPLIGHEGDRRIYLDWIGQDVEFEQFLGSWQFFQSGFFADRSGIWLDSLDRAACGAPEGWKPCVAIGIAEVILRFTAIFEFAYKLSASIAGDEQMCIEVRVAGLSGRKLYADYPSAELLTLGPFKTSIREFPFDNEYPRGELMRKSREFALEASREIFRRFGWDPTWNVLKKIQTDVWC